MGCMDEIQVVHFCFRQTSGIFYKKFYLLRGFCFSSTLDGPYVDFFFWTLRFRLLDRSVEENRLPTGQLEVEPEQKRVLRTDKERSQ